MVAPGYDGPKSDQIQTNVPLWISDQSALYRLYSFVNCALREPCVHCLAFAGLLCIFDCNLLYR